MTITHEQLKAFDAAHGTRDDGQIGAINLEGLTQADLAIAKEHPALHQDVRRIADIIIQSRRHRRAGNIQRALRLEEKAQDLYETLPKELRW